MPDLDQIKQGEQAVSARCVCYIIPLVWTSATCQSIEVPPTIPANSAGSTRMMIRCTRMEG